MTFFWKISPNFLKSLNIFEQPKKMLLSEARINFLICKLNLLFKKSKTGNKEIWLLFWKIPQYSWLYLVDFQVSFAFLVINKRLVSTSGFSNFYDPQNMKNQLSSEKCYFSEKTPMENKFKLIFSTCYLKKLNWTTCSQLNMFIDKAAKFIYRLSSGYVLYSDQLSFNAVSFNCLSSL